MNTSLELETVAIGEAGIISTIFCLISQGNQHLPIKFALKTHSERRFLIQCVKKRNKEAQQCGQNKQNEVRVSVSVSKALEETGSLQLHLNYGPCPSTDC